MNSYYKIIHWLEQELQSDIDINTVTHGDSKGVDMEKKNIYPLAHIEVLRAGFPQGMTRVDFKVSVLDQRNHSQETITDKFLKNDNEIDILNTLLAVVNKLVNKLQNVENGIELLNEPEANPIQYDYMNTLDGWEIELQLAVQSDIAC